MAIVISHITHLECPRCHRKYSADALSTYCVCGSPLFAKYDTTQAREDVEKGQFPSQVNSMWRYSQLMPVKSPLHVISLGEGWTPMLTPRRLGKHLGLKMLRIKDESQNPTASFKDRGLCTAVSKHVELGVNEFALPSAGNAAVSMSAYCAAAGAKATIFMPADTPRPFFDECRLFGAETISVEGDISDAGREMNKMNGDWTVLSTTKEPYRVEGKKTLGFEICEQSGWRVPDIVICPTGGGTAVIGIWKAFDELEALGLIGRERPRMFAAQSGGCAPIVHAFEKGLDTIEPWMNGRTQALGLRVPSPFAGRLILQALRRSGGGAVAVADQDIVEIKSMVGKMEGMNICPESAVAIAGLRNLLESGKIDYDEDVVLLNTGNGSRYTNLRGSTQDTTTIDSQ
ncbi:MAG: threonine synthase [Candidatus Thorarchaeota archaeon]|nr:MAG: threonine synthase [Candidatus Thorarchaeota archaeon]